MIRICDADIHGNLVAFIVRVYKLDIPLSPMAQTVVDLLLAGF